MESKPVLSVPIHEYLKVHLCDLYENDCIFDKFECAASTDGQYALFPHMLMTLVLVVDP